MNPECSLDILSCFKYNMCDTIVGHNDVLLLSHYFDDNCQLSIVMNCSININLQPDETHCYQGDVSMIRHLHHYYFGNLYP